MGSLLGMWSVDCVGSVECVGSVDCVGSVECVESVDCVGIGKCIGVCLFSIKKTNYFVSLLAKIFEYS